MKWFFFFQGKAQTKTALVKDFQTLKAELAKVTTDENNKFKIATEKQRAKENFEESYRSLAELEERKIQLLERLKKFEVDQAKSKSNATEALAKFSKCRLANDEAQRDRDKTARDLREKYENPVNSLKLDLAKLTKEKTRLQNLQARPFYFYICPDCYNFLADF